MPGAEESLLLLLPAPRGSNAFSPCVALLPSAPEPQTPTLCPWPGQDLSSGHDHTLARSQELQCSSSTPTQPGLPAVRAGAGWEVLQEHQQTPATGTPFSWDRLIPAGAAVDAKLPLRVLQPHSVLGQPTPGSRPQQRGKPRARRGRGGSQLSPEAPILTCAFSFTCSYPRSEAAASVLLPSPLGRSTHRVPTKPKQLCLQHPHKSLVTENIY